MAPGHVGGRSAHSGLRLKTYQSLTSKIRMGQVKNVQKETLRWLDWTF